MSKNEVCGIPLEDFEDPINDALKEYFKRIDGFLTLQEGATPHKLELTPTRPNSARSVTPLMRLGDEVTKMYVIVFAPGDGTGDESKYKLDEVHIGSYYPRNARILPRAKLKPNPDESIHSETHLTISSHNLESPNAEPQLFGGNLDLVGVKGDDPIKITKVAEIGQPICDYSSGRDDLAEATMTVGYRDGSDQPTVICGERYGDPHAVYNSHKEALQVCAFIAISGTMALKYLELFDLLGAREPRWNIPQS